MHLLGDDKRHLLRCTVQVFPTAETIPAALATAGKIAGMGQVSVEMCKEVSPTNLLPPPLLLCFWGAHTSPSLTLLFFSPQPIGHQPVIRDEPAAGARRRVASLLVNFRDQGPKGWLAAWRLGVRGLRFAVRDSRV
jgi:hypothetical protein